MSQGSDLVGHVEDGGLLVRDAELVGEDHDAVALRGELLQALLHLGRAPLPVGLVLSKH